MHSSKYPHVFSPYRLGRHTVKNRIIAAPSSLVCVEDVGKFTEQELTFWELKAEGGAGIVTHGEAIVDSATGLTKDRAVRLDNPNSLPHLARLAHVIKRHGALANIQLAHAGLWGGLASLGGENKPGSVSYGPSAMNLPQGEVREMPEDMLLRIIESFGKAAGWCKWAGFDMVMIHGAHGWFFSQFLSKEYNHRTDYFGGSFENRARVYTMALDSIRRHVGPGFPIEVRINGSDCYDLIGKDDGLTLDDAVQLARLIKGKCDLINVSAGIHEDVYLFERMIPSMFHEPGVNVPFAEAVKKAVGNNVAVSCVGAVHDPDLMEDVIASGKADFVEVGRALLADPFLPRKAELGLDPRDVRPCIRCDACIENALKLTECAVNPIIMHERDDQIRRALPTTRKRVLVAGGGPAGMEVAVTTAGRGHEVILCEKKGELGGTIDFAKHVSFKSGLYRFSEHLKYKVAKAAVDVRLNTPVTPSLVDETRPEVLFVAVGSLPIVPALPGVDGDNVCLAVDVFGNEDRVGQTVVVLGGGQVGCETAAHLARLGRSVTVVEMLDDFAVDTGILIKAALELELKNDGVKLLTSATGVAITEQGLHCKDNDGAEWLCPADTIVCAVGYASTNPAVEELRYAAPRVHIIGDARTPAKVKEAVALAHWLALDI